MNKSEYPLKKRRGDAPVVTILAMLTVAALSALTAFGFGGIIAISLSGVAFAYLLLTKKNIIPWLILPVSFGIGYLISGDVLSSAAVLLFAPVGALLAITVHSKKSLSFTVVCLTVVIFIAQAAYLTLNVTEVYGEGIKESYLALGKDVEGAAREVFSAFRYEGANKEEVFALSDEDITSLLKTAMMLLPAVSVITCELMAYGTAKLLYLFLNVFGYESIYNKPYAVTLSAPAGAVFIAAYFVSFFSQDASIAAYSALNLTYILMPLAAIAGFHVLFSKSGIFRNPKSRTVRMPVIISCAICALFAPFSFIPLLAMFGSAGAVTGAVNEYLRSRKKDGDQ